MDLGLHGIPAKRGSKHHCSPERQKRKTISGQRKAAAAFTQTATELERKHLRLCLESVWQSIYGIIYTAAVTPCLSLRTSGPITCVSLGLNQEHRKQKTAYQLNLNQWGVSVICYSQGKSTN